MQNQYDIMAINPSMADSIGFFAIEVAPCNLNKLIAQLRIKPQLAGAWLCFNGHSSSANTTSLTQCSQFSIPQWP